MPEVTFCDFNSTDHEYRCSLFIYQVTKVSVIELSAYELVVGPESVAYNLGVFNVRDWLVSWPPSQDWIQSIPHPGEVRMVIDRNTSTSDRLGYIMITNVDGGDECFVEILQKGADVEIPELVTVDVELPYDATEFQITATNIDSESAHVLVPSGIDWAKHEFIDESNDSFLFSINENQSSSSRSVKITIQDRYLFSYRINLNQKSK